jgi:hypothetical protein
MKKSFLMLAVCALGLSNFALNVEAVSVQGKVDLVLRDKKSDLMEFFAGRGDYKKRGKMLRNTVMTMDTFDGNLGDAEITLSEDVKDAPAGDTREYSFELPSIATTAINELMSGDTKKKRMRLPSMNSIVAVLQGTYTDDAMPAMKMSMSSMKSMSSISEEVGEEENVSDMKSVNKTVEFDVKRAMARVNKKGDVVLTGRLRASSDKLGRGRFRIKVSE